MDDDVDLEPPSTDRVPDPDTEGPGPESAEGDRPRADFRTAGTSPRRPLRRSSRDRIIGGVAAGLAEYFDLSPLAVRSLFGFAALVVVINGFGRDAYDGHGLFGLGALLSVLAAAAVIAYLVLWIVVQRDDEDATRVGRLAGRFPRLAAVVGILAVLAGVAVLGGQLGLWDDGLVFPLLLIAGGVLLYRRDGWRSRTTTGEPAADAPLEDGTAHASPPGSAYAVTPATPATGTPGSGTPTLPLPVVSEPPRPPRPPREHSPLGWLGLGIALLVVGVMAILQNLGAIDVPIVRYPAVVLVILAATMLVGAFVGRARWLVLPALLVVPIVLATSMITVPLEGGAGNLYAKPPTSAAVQGSYRRVIGDVTLDLAELAGTQAAPIVSASTGAGTIAVVVPFDAHVIATGNAGLGAVHLGPLDTDTTFDATLHTRMEPGRGDGPTITLDLETGIGDIWVTRAFPTRAQLRALEKSR